MKKCSVNLVKVVLPETHTTKNPWATLGGSEWTENKVEDDVVGQDTPVVKGR